MPIHDWTRADPNLFHDFRQTWGVLLCHALNAGQLPKRMSALVEPHASDPDPEAPVPERLAARGNRIVVRHALGEVVSVIEIVSPGNKHSRRAMREFLDKTIGFLDAGVHVLVVDLFPPTPRDPHGMHKAVWDEFNEDAPFDPPAGKPLTLAAYVATTGGVRAYVEPVAVGDPLPDMPAYLTTRAYVPVPLEATYQATWAACPEDMRTLVETGRLPDDEG